MRYDAWDYALLADSEWQGATLKPDHAPLALSQAPDCVTAQAEAIRENRPFSILPRMTDTEA